MLIFEHILYDTYKFLYLSKIYVLCFAQMLLHFQTDIFFDFL